MRITFVAIGAGSLLLASACARPELQNKQPSATQQNSTQQAQQSQVESSSPSQAGEAAAQQFIKGFSIKVVSVKRAKEWEDPRFKGADFGPAGGPHLQARKAGFEFAIVRVDVKRLDENARFQLKEIWILDASGKKYKSPVLFQDELGESAAETREFVFSVPIKSELKRIQLSADTFIELP